MLLQAGKQWGFKEFSTGGSDKVISLPISYSSLHLFVNAVTFTGGNSDLAWNGITIFAKTTTNFTAGYAGQVKMGILFISGGK